MATAAGSSVGRGEPVALERGAEAARCATGRPAKIWPPPLSMTRIASGARARARGEQAAEVVREADVAEHEQHRLAGARGAGRRRDQPVDAGGAALGEHRRAARRRAHT